MEVPNSKLNMKSMIKYLLFTVIVLVFTLNVFSQVPNYVPTSGLVGWWPFNGNANDESGNGNNGTVNGATLTTDRLGNVNAAYSFDGIDDFISGNSNNLNVQTTNKLLKIYRIRCFFSLYYLDCERHGNQET